MSIRRRHHNPLRAPRQLIDEAMARVPGYLATSRGGTVLPACRNAQMLTGNVNATTRSLVDEALTIAQSEP